MTQEGTCSETEALLGPAGEGGSRDIAVTGQEDGPALQISILLQPRRLSRPGRCGYPGGVSRGT